MEPLPKTLTERTAFLLAMAVRNAEGMAVESLAGFGISPRGYGVMALVQATPGLTQREIGSTLHIDRTTTMKLLNELEARGFARRVRGEDRRSYVIELTARGQEGWESAYRALGDCEDRFLGPLSPGDRSELRRMLLALGSVDGAGAK